MLTQSEIRTIARDQLALDLGCAPELLDTSDNCVLEWQSCPGRRTYRDDAPFLELAIWNGKLVAAVHAALLPWCREYLLPIQAEWLFQPAHFRSIDSALAPFGYEIGDAHHFYLPNGVSPEPVSPCPVAWYECTELEQFREDRRWSGALDFNPRYPDMLAVAALDACSAPIAMAGASQDGARLWQIGIHVLPPYRNRGLAVYLTTLLKNELLNRGIVPFYGTAESHIFSQNTAIRAGFRPAFGYLYAVPAKIL